MYIRAQARHTVIKRMLFPTISPSTKKSPISASQHPFYRLPFSQFLLLLLQKWQRKSEELNSIQTALQIWDFQATPVWSSSVFVTQMMNVLKSSRSDLFFSVCGQHTHTLNMLSETCICNVRIVIIYYIDFSIKRFYRLLRINLLFVQVLPNKSASIYIITE